MMIPLRRALIVQQHGLLKYPEGTACAEVLKAGVDEESREVALKNNPAISLASGSEFQLWRESDLRRLWRGACLPDRHVRAEVLEDTPERCSSATRGRLHIG